MKAVLLVESKDRNKCDIRISNMIAYSFLIEQLKLDDVERRLSGMVYENDNK